MPRAKKLTDTAIRRQLQAGRNYKRLYSELKGRFDELKTDVKALRAENRELRELLSAAQAQLRTQSIQIAELQTMVFGKQKKPPTGTVIPVLAPPVSMPRTKASYRRPIPPAAAITTEVAVPLPKTCACGGGFAPDDGTTPYPYSENIPRSEPSPDRPPPPAPQHCT